jgi:DNA-directed RNA polymerase subunit RPC12/RpoP
MTDEKKPIAMSEVSSDKDERGLVCRKCGCRDFRVDTTRDVADGIARYRVCRNCGRRIRTIEK